MIKGRETGGTEEKKTGGRLLRPVSKFYRKRSLLSAEIGQVCINMKMGKAQTTKKKKQLSTLLKFPVLQSTFATVPVGSITAGV